MGTRLKTDRGNNLYAFWGSQISLTLNTWSTHHTEKTIINLASNEYFKSVDKKTLQSNVITPVFLEEKEGKARVISFMAKRARGMMARYMVQERIEQPEGIKNFNVAGYTFQPTESDDNRWVFKRPQPPPAKR
jgi:cytoplasmic iron level regulating protein YaaA (DUF328/UPF0246 family)